MTSTVDMKEGIVGAPSTTGAGAAGWLALLRFNPATT
jgi:hypothetical protein